jgi:hypothetical protein
MKHEQAWVTLAEALGPRSPFLKTLLGHFETPEAILEADEAAIRKVLPDIGAGILSALVHKKTE